MERLTNIHAEILDFLQVGEPQFVEKTIVNYTVQEWARPGPASDDHGCPRPHGLAGMGVAGTGTGHLKFAHVKPTPAVAEYGLRYGCRWLPVAAQ